MNGDAVNDLEKKFAVGLGLAKIVVFGALRVNTWVPASTKNFCITFVQCWSNVEDVGPTLYKCYTKVLCFLGSSHFHSPCSRCRNTLIKVN